MTPRQRLLRLAGKLLLGSMDGLERRRKGVLKAAIAYAHSTMPSDDALSFAIRELHRKRDDGPERLTKRNEAMCAQVGDYLTKLLEARAGGPGGAAHPDKGDED